MTVSGLNDDLVILMRKESRENPDKTARYFSALYGISESTINKAITGNTYSRLNTIEPPFIRNSCLISDEIVIDARRRVRENPELRNRDLAKEYNVSLSILERAIRGYSYIHLDALEAPVIRVLKKEDKITLARELYQMGKSYRDIQKEINVSKSSLSNWLRDIVRPPKKANAPIERIPAEHPYLGFTIHTSKSKNGEVRYRLENPTTGERLLLTRRRYLMSVKLGRLLTHNEVVSRKEGKDDNIENLVLYTKEEYQKSRKNNLDAECVECGNTFTKKNKTVSTCSKKCAISFRQKNKEKTLGSRVLICKECGTEYSSTCNHSKFCSSKCRNANMLKIRNANKPVKILKPKPIKVPKVKVPKVKQYHQIECVICEKMFQTTNVNREICYDKACKNIIDTVDEWG